MNAKECLVNVEKMIDELDELNKRGGSMRNWKRYSAAKTNKYCFDIGEVCDECGIFDWWKDTLSTSDLKQMKKFLEQAILLGFKGYVCFKVGVPGCTHGMWAHKNESTTGYSPDGDVLYHSFRRGDNYYDMCINNVWMHNKYATKENPCPDFTLKQIREELLNRN